MHNKLAAAMAGVAALAVATVPAVAQSAAMPQPAGSVASPQAVFLPTQFIVGQPIDAGSFSCGDSYFYTQNVPMIARWTGSSGTGGSSPTVYDLTVDTGSQPTTYSNTTNTTMNISGTNYQADCGGGFYSPTLTLTAHGATTAASATTGSHNFTLGAYDEAGQVSESSLGAAASNFVASYSTGWATATCACFHRGADEFTTTRSARATYRFSTTAAGEYVAVVSPEATDRGKMTISLDGGVAQTVDTFSYTGTNRVIVWQAPMASMGNHTVTVTNLATAGRPRIDVDALLINNNR